jgi:hypothetical protein
MRNISEFLTRYYKVIAWCLLIFTLSSIPTLPKVGFIWWDFLLKKAAHMLEYALLFFLSYRAIDKKGNWKTPFLFALAFALSDEYHQSFVPGRTARFLDIGFDSLGMLIAYLRLRN